MLHCTCYNHDRPRSMLSKLRSGFLTHPLLCEYLALYLIFNNLKSIFSTVEHAVGIISEFIIMNENYDKRDRLCCWQRKIKSDSKQYNYCIKLILITFVKYSNIKIWLKYKAVGNFYYFWVYKEKISCHQFKKKLIKSYHRMIHQNTWVQDIITWIDKSYIP